MYIKVILFLKILILSYSFIFSSCTSRIGMEIERLRSLQIEIPLSNFEKIQSPLKMESQTNAHLSAYRFIVFVDSSNCTPCIIDKIGEWYSIYQKANKIKPVNFYFIFEKSEGIKKSLLFNKIPFDIYIDNQGIMKKLNPFLTNHLYHNFMINDKNKLLFIGDPRKSEQIETVFLTLLQSHTKTERNEQ